MTLADLSSREHVQRKDSWESSTEGRESSVVGRESSAVRRTLINGNLGSTSLPRTFMGSAAVPLPKRILAERSKGNAATTTTTTSSGISRCFRVAHLCKLSTRDDDLLVSAARALRKRYEAEIRVASEKDPAAGGELWSNGSTAAGGHDAVLRVAFASRPVSSASRKLLNQEELLDLCNAWQPPPLVGVWTTARCISRHFGSSPGGVRMRPLRLLLILLQLSSLVVRYASRHWVCLQC